MKNSLVLSLSKLIVCNTNHVQVVYRQRLFIQPSLSCLRQYGTIKAPETPEEDNGSVFSSVESNGEDIEEGEGAKSQTIAKAMVAYMERAKDHGTYWLKI